MEVHRAVVSLAFLQHNRGEGKERGEEKRGLKIRKWKKFGITFFFFNLRLP